MNASGRPSADALFAAGADGIRIVAFDDPAFFAYAGDLGVSLTVAVVLARESFPTDDYAGMATFYAERCQPDYWILGNECDAYLLAEPSPSSWKMRPTEYAHFWAEAARGIRARQPDAKLLVAGLVSGQPSYAYEVSTLLDPAPHGYDIHPYGKSAEETRELLRLYQEAIG